MNNRTEKKNHYYSAAFIEDPWQLLKRYMPIIWGDALLGCFSIALAAILAMLTYLSTYPIGFATKTSFFGAAGLGAVFAIAKYQVLYGRIQWAWLNVAIYLICLLVSLPTIAYGPNVYLYSMTLLGPLTGLLILNSNRCRELRHKMVEIRHKREAIITSLKNQGRWKWW
ncbi:hypothetical protein ACI77J_16380 [Pseudomonas sp. O64]|uniref:hypothetical protein n=1 Tax=unclassified Pseudomonas TaxID=196821 RepID=UPI001F55C15C|nr:MULTISPECIES: hypothetical protein [unclassified Pseudomonas]UNM17961.1 hypothetical protein K0P33_20645 [Pseudomonas sp. ArH3a]UXZ20803.1 hypothetical protein KZH41_20030 [Pseudomonas sp. YeP6b]